MLPNNDFTQFIVYTSYKTRCMTDPVIEQPNIFRSL